MYAAIVVSGVAFTRKRRRRALRTGAGAHQLNGEPIGRLAVGQRFDMSLLDTIGDVALIDQGRLVRSTLPQPLHAQITRQLED